ncbi:MAG: hypothetical protein LC659_12785, partial [Myxococcales bacterium]|nr:hypothetical protein [Myxococcales bacterium]
MTVAVLLSAPPSGGAAPRRAQASAALEAAERARGADVVGDPLALVAAGWTAEANLAFFARGAQLVSDGRRALARVELEKAEALFGAAETIYRDEGARPGIASEWAEAAKWHGVALFELKRAPEAARAWALAKRLERGSELTEAAVRPEVARAFAAAPVADAAPIAERAPDVERAPAIDVEGVQRTLGIDEVIVAAIAIDGGALTYAATLRRASCATDVVTATRADELARRLGEAPCRSGAPADVLAAEAIAHPRPPPALVGRAMPLPSP